MSLTSVNASNLEQNVPNNSSFSLNLWGHFNQIIKGTGLIGVSAIVYFGFTRWFSGQSAVSEQPDTLSQTLVATNNAQRWQIPTTSRAPKLALESFDSLSLAYRQKSSSVTTVQANLSHCNLRQTQADDYLYRPIGSTFRVDSTHPNAVTPSVVSLTNGDFVVIWCGTDSNSRSLTEVLK